MDLQLRGRTAFVTGSTQGIGRAIAETLLAEGAAVVVSGRDGTRVRAVVEDLRAAVPDADVSGIAADLADPAQVQRLLAELGDVDVLVSCAGVFGLAAFAEVSDAEWQHYVEVNLMGGVRLSRHLLPRMLERGWGRVVFVGTESAVDVPADMVPYGATKAAALALANGLAKLTRGTEVTVNTVLGGPTWSDGVAAAVAEVARSQGAPVEAVRDAVVAGNPTSLLQRFIDPAEIAHLVAYLASPLSSATNGAALRADGGVLTTVL
ncbi:SDR family NAD(P)-dependent oxidoreductase [Nocardioides sp. Arc9.136]|uniref:SDR family NAD(P)-dependent oxidoreductase n=1 Tax=Nocardioides sp. Arc9.136 TaxID=2996826 RepID=UPI0026650E06|nr:SDR family NAD(P)-dependent oxidoreductase [Nocardioides sp. Arc9.136]WKN49138.1 SDR family NAD(P)-dependent oxidoreductase [Nocardioides sp. Arc9.136]